jgi:hypothetical protein
MDDFKLIETIVKNNADLFGSMLRFRCGTVAKIFELKTYTNSISIQYTNVDENRFLTVHIEYDLKIELFVYVTDHTDDFRDIIRNIIVRQYKVHKVLN